jgi:hypothetical protein
MQPILTVHRQPAHDIAGRQRLQRLGGFSASQVTDAMTWLAGYAPHAFDAALDAIEPCTGDGSDEPAPVCAQCGADIGIFLKYGLDWRHYRGTTVSDIELFDPGHAPALAWRTATPA